MPKKCAFCTHPADSREHIFSEWMLKMLPPSERYTFNERVIKTGEYVRYQGRKVKIKAKVVCERCNNNWMSQLEEKHLKPAMKDLLFGDLHTVLSPKETTPIAAFAFKTLILANHKDLTSTPFFPSAQRVRFRLTLRIPDGVQVWIASRKGFAGKYYGFWKSAHGQTDKQSIYGFRNYICTWNFQNVVLQILANKWENKRRRNTVPPIAFLQDDYWKDASILIWPPDGTSVQWPPPLYLGDDTIEAFRDRWDTIRVTVPPM